MQELYDNGPVTVSFIVYLDVYSYKSGVYHHVFGPQQDGHVVKIIGYRMENGTKYWLAANSWNDSWGATSKFVVGSMNAISSLTW